tara:strand:- start:166509 stop:167354 length:846 start_codon:yes stop_codon:yes gene_type:complete
MSVHRFLITVVSGLALTSVVASSSQLLGAELPDRISSGQVPVAIHNLPSHTTAEWLRGMNRSQLAGDAQNIRNVAPAISDVALDKHGYLNGTIVDNLGLPQAGVLVVARQGKETPLTARTDVKGAFKLASMKGGNWSVTAGSETSWVRTWNADLAPPAAKSNFLVVSKAPVIRGQSGDGGLLAAFDTGTLFSVGAGITGVTLGVIGISEASEANDEADSAQASANQANDEAAALRDQLNTLSMTVSDQGTQLNSLSTTVSNQATQLNALQIRVDELEATLN